MSAPSWQTVLEDGEYNERVEVYIGGRTFYLTFDGAITLDFIGRGTWSPAHRQATKEAARFMHALSAATFKPSDFHQALMVVRDNIAWRVAQRQTTSENERMILFAVDAELDKQSAPSAELPDEAIAIMANLKGEDR
jgi:hypothetical protein